MSEYTEVEQPFLRVRLSLGGDVLNPYKTTIARWIWPGYRMAEQSGVENQPVNGTAFRRETAVSES